MKACCIALVAVFIASLIGLGGYVLGGAAVRFFFHLAQGF